MVLRRPALLALLLAVACSGPRSEGSARPGGAAAPGGGPGSPAPPPKPKSPAEQARDLLAEGTALGRAGSWGPAAEALEKAFTLDRSLLQAARGAGVWFDRAGEDARAAAAYRAALAEKPDFVEASHDLTMLLLRTGRAAEAEADLRARLERFPLTPLRDQLVEALAAQGRLDAAEAEARAVLRTAEQDGPAMVSLASVYYARKRYELARMVLENARQVHPEDPAVWNKLGFVELAMGNRPQALEDFRKAAGLRDDYPEAHVNYGAMLVEAEDFPGARKELELAVRYAPASAAAWLGLGNALRGEKRFEEADRAYRRALALSPGMAEAEWGLAVLYLDVESPAIPTLQRLERALGHLDRYAAAGGDDPHLAAYRKEGLAEVEKEKKRLARDEKDRLRKEAEARRKQEAEELQRREQEEKRLAEARARLAAAPAPAEAAPGTTAPTAPAPSDAPPATATAAAPPPSEAPPATATAAASAPVEAPPATAASSAPPPPADAIPATVAPAPVDASPATLLKAAAAATTLDEK